MEHLATVREVSLEMEGGTFLQGVELLVFT